MIHAHLGWMMLLPLAAGRWLSSLDVCNDIVRRSTNATATVTVAVSVASLQIKFHSIGERLATVNKYTQDKAKPGFVQRCNACFN